MGRAGRDVVVAVLALALGAGCGQGGEAERPPGADALGEVTPSGPAEPASGREPGPAGESGGSESEEWTAAVVETAPPRAPMTTLWEVRASRNQGFDRVVFEFAGDTLPGYRAEYVDRPVRECGSGEPAEIAGEGWLSITVDPARAHDEQGRVTVEEREMAPGLPVLKELRLVCDFEGQVEWVLGLAAPNRYRVMELADPARLVVDVRH